MTPPFRRRLRERVAILADALEKDMPDLIIGGGVAMIFRMSLADEGLAAAITEFTMRHMVEQARQYSRLCSICDNPIATEKTRPPLCGACLAKHAGENFEDEMEGKP